MTQVEHGDSEPSIVFGREQGLFAYNMASSLTSGTDRPVIERAHDATQTAVRLFDRPDVDIELAVEGLMGALESGFDSSASK